MMSVYVYMKINSSQEVEQIHISRDRYRNALTNKHIHFVLTATQFKIFFSFCTGVIINACIYNKPRVS